MNIKYQKIVDKLVKKSFPSLKYFKIFLTEKKVLKFRYSATTFYLLFFGVIILHPKVRKYSNSALYALLAHELSHLDIIVRKSFTEKLKFAFKWLSTKKEKIEMEREADTLVIKKGYGKGLLKLVKTVSKQKDAIKNREKKGYLTSKEIEKLLRRRF